MHRSTALLALLLAAPAGAADLDIVGACPGPITIEGSGFTPNTTVFLLRAAGPGTAFVPSGTCAGTELDLDAPRLLARVRTGATGAFSLPVTAPGAACGLALQALDVASCDTSDVEGLSRVASCTVDMDTVCPNVTPVCGATFSGGGGCIQPNFATCTTDAPNAYVIPVGQTVRIDFAQDVNDFRWLLATINGGTTLTRTFDENGDVITVSGSAGFECDVGFTPQSGADVFRPWRAVEVTAVGGEAYIDSLTINDR